VVVKIAKMRLGCFDDCTHHAPSSLPHTSGTTLESRAVLLDIFCGVS
jgi:hypothetical protein